MARDGGRERYLVQVVSLSLDCDSLSDAACLDRR